MRIPEKFRSGETLKKDIGPKLNTMVDFMKSLMVRGDKATIAVKHTPGGSFISSLVQPVGGSGGGGASADAYAGPFALSITDDEEITVLAGDVFLGVETENYAGGTIAVSTDKIIYLRVTYSGGYSIVLGSGSALPAQDSLNYYIGLGRVTATGGILQTVEQWQYGNHYGAGRVF